LFVKVYFIIFISSAKLKEVKSNVLLLLGFIRYGRSLNEDEELLGACSLKPNSINQNTKQVYEDKNLSSLFYKDLTYH
jgi:hypothetical protein